MTTYVPPKKNTAFILYVSLVDQSNTKLFKSNPTLAAGDFKVSIDGGALNNLTTLPTVTPAAGKMVKISLSSSEMNGDNITVVCSDAAGSEWCDLTINLQTSARQVDDLAYPATSGRSMVVDAAGLVDANTVKVGPTGSGTAQTAGDIPARLPAALVSGRMDSSVGAMAADTLTSSALATSAVTEIQTGLSTLDAAGVRSAVGLASANLDTQIATLATAANLATVAGYLDTEIAAILADTNELQTDWANGGRLDLILDSIAAASAPTADENADALLDRANGIETGYTLRQTLRIVSAVLAGKASGFGTATSIFRDLNDSKDRVISTTDGDGNRSSVTKDVS